MSMSPLQKPTFNLISLLLHVFLSLSSNNVQAKCKTGCDLALASYYLSPKSNLTYISTIFNLKIPEILPYNPQIKNQDSISTGDRINVPFSCSCLNNDFLGHTFSYTTQFSDTYNTVAETSYANLTTADWVERVNVYDSFHIPDDSLINVTVNCSCGDQSVSKDYGLFVTYPLRPGESLASIAAEVGVSAEIVERYNPEVEFDSGSGIVFLPVKDKDGNFPPLEIRSSGMSKGAIAGISVASVIGALLVSICLYVGLYKRKKVTGPSLLHNPSQELYILRSEATSLDGSYGLAGITVDKSVEFSYDELAKATHDFSLANKIGQGGFGSVYLADLRGEKVAIKKMEMQASKEFLAELKVLTNVHHLNLVRLIGYCAETCLFVVYEYIEKGNLSQHLRGSGKISLPWPSRVRIALDSARGLEYIHEHTVPVYIHRDIKSANILLDKNFRAKVADFGLTKLSEYGSNSLQTRVVGTFGYMPPEYAQYGEISPKLDVYAFGVVLYELISAKHAIIKTNEVVSETMGLVALFEDVLTQPDAKEDLRKLVDPRLTDDYPMDEVFKMAHLAKACTHDNPQLRPSMRSIVVALVTLSSSTEDWVESFYENRGLVNLMMSGR